MSQSIIVRFHGPTDSRGSRYSARCEAGRLSVEADDALSDTKNRQVAFKALAHRLIWAGWWVEGSLPDGAGVFVYAGPLSMFDEAPSDFFVRVP
jgi:hypothetical protein